MGETTTAITAVKQEVQHCDWAAQIEAQQASGMTVQKWCAENGINPKTYYYHLRKLREKCVVSAPTIVPINVPKRTSDIHIEKNGLQINVINLVSKPRTYAIFKNFIQISFIKIFVFYI